MIYKYGHAVWSSGTYNKGATQLRFQGDGNLVIYRGSTALWSSGTYGHPRLASYDYYLRVGDYIGCHGAGVSFAEAQIKLNDREIWSTYCH